MRERPAYDPIRLIPALLLLSGCGAGEPVSDGSLATDSAGIEVVTNTAPAWQDGEAWTIAETPSVDIGREQGEAPYMLADAHGATVMADGRIAVADMMSNQIRFFSAGGEFLGSSGGSGAGPGEFEQLYRLKHVAGDSLMALEPATLTSMFSPDGRYIRRFELDPVPGWSNIWWLGYLDGGRLVAVSLAREGTRHLPSDDGVHESVIVTPEKAANYRDSLMHFVYDMDGRMLDSIGRMPGQNLGRSEMPFPPHAAYAFKGDRMYHSPGDLVDIRIYRLSDSGDDRMIADAPRARSALRLERAIRQGSLAGLAVTDSIRDAYRDQQRARLKDMAKRGADVSYMERKLLETEFPATIPAHGNRMYVDADDNVWLQAFSVDPRRDATSWLIFNDAGRWLGRVETPERFVLNEVGRDYVLGIWRDEMDVEHVRRYAIVKPR